MPGRFGRSCLATLLAAAGIAAAATSSATAEEVFTSQAAASNATDSTWIPAPPRRAAVCIVDTGTDTTPDTTNVIARLAVDGSDGSDTSPIKHGTLMATIASAPKNDFGMVGAAPSINVVSVRASTDGHTFAGLDVYAAIQACITRRNLYNIKVVSLSLGGDGSTVTASVAQRTEFEDAIDNARIYGLNVVAAAGNSERGVVDWPAGYGPTFAIGAATTTGARCSFASWGAAVDLWAPGCPLDVGRPDSAGSPAWANGSSEATALLAAILAQMRGLAGGLSVEAAERTIVAAARPAEAGSFIDAGEAFRAVGLEAAIASGHSSIPLPPSAAAVMPPTTSSESHLSANDSLSGGATSPRNGEAAGPSGIAVSKAPTASTTRPPVRLARPIVRAASLRRGHLIVSLTRRPKGVETRLEIYARTRGSQFPTIAKRARFRTDTLRIRVSGAITQLSIGYRDPTGVRMRSEVVVVHPRT